MKIKRFSIEKVNLNRIEDLFSFANLDQAKSI